MKTLTTRDGKEIKTYRELRSLQNISIDETGTIEYQAKFNGEDCTIYRHWSNKELGFFIYKGNSITNKIAKINENQGVLEFEIIKKNIEPDPFTKSNLIDKSSNVFTAVHINGKTASIQWYGTNSFGKNVPLFGSDYYDLHELPELIKNHFGEIEPTTVKSGVCGSYVRNGEYFEEFKDLVKNAY